MKIRDIKGVNVRACCSFSYRGKEISISTICSPVSIVVFEDDKVLYDATSVERAINWIDNNTKDED
jgi:hypothetical protein